MLHQQKGLHTLLDLHVESPTNNSGYMDTDMEPTQSPKIQDQRRLMERRSNTEYYSDNL